MFTIKPGFTIGAYIAFTAVISGMGGFWLGKLSNQMVVNSSPKPLSTPYSYPNSNPNINRYSDAYPFSVTDYS